MFEPVSASLFPEDQIWLDRPRMVGSLFSVFDEARATGMLGVDVEFDSGGRPTILGVSTPALASSSPWAEAWAREIEDLAREGIRLIGYASLSADARFFQVPGESWEDSMIIHYLLNADLCSLPGKADDPEETEAESYGFMNLWTAASLFTVLPNWKRCRGRLCSGPCPNHDPHGYCALDSWAALMIWAEACNSLREVVPWKIYERLKRLTLIGERMRERGIPVDWEGVSRAARRMSQEASEIQTGLPFNPRSPSQILSWARAHGLDLESASLESVRTALEELTDSLDEPPGTDPALTLWKLMEFKRLGKGLDPWFHRRYRGKDGRLHPRLNVTGTSSGRFSMSGPNMQNVPRVGWGKEVRKLILPEPGQTIVKLDYSQLELRMCLYLAGVELDRPDAFSWLVEASNGKITRAAERIGWKPRDLAKSVSHAGNYMEGVVLIEPWELGTTRVQSQIRAGALKVFRNWEFMGHVVGFNGVNLARRLFGNASLENRAKALEIQEIYFESFPTIRKWQRETLSRVQESRVVRSPTGRFLRLHALEPQKMAKVAPAFLGQGVSADYVQAAMIRLDDSGFLPMLQIHDELVFSVPQDKALDTARRIKDIMEEEDHELLPGFRVPTKVSIGPSWGEAEEVSL